MTVNTLQQAFVRSIIETDFVQWLRLWKGYNLFYKRDSLSQDITQTTWNRFFDINEPIHALVVEQEGQLIGFAHYLFHRSTIQINHVCYLQDLFVNEANRGQGIGKVLITMVYKKARAVGAPRVYWQTQENNTEARKLYDSVANVSGFIVYNKPIE